MGSERRARAGRPAHGLGAEGGIWLWREGDAPSFLRGKLSRVPDGARLSRSDRPVSAAAEPSHGREMDADKKELYAHVGEWRWTKCVS